MRLQAACLFLSMAVASAPNVAVEVGAKPVGARGEIWSRVMESSRLAETKAQPTIGLRVCLHLIPLSSQPTIAFIATRTTAFPPCLSSRYDFCAGRRRNMQRVLFAQHRYCGPGEH